MAEVFLKCVKEGGRLRVRIISPGYYNDANCQFPRAIRQEGRYFSVPRESITLSQTASCYFYRVRDPITVLDEAPNVSRGRKKKPTIKKDKVDETPKFENIEIFTDENEKECVICLDTEKEVVFIPCGHYCSCLACAQKLSPSKCPMCRTAIKHTVDPADIK
ncbi:hypothetical protein O9G_002264 [Rozella allomycis CSF55]|uniref:RING-type domain-containing protein n=1 Tax=Rozella allomycis (strain CSF55) TaxID=988480 RepID=A0A075B1G7_ROZAC|nr:hypothetical protein O9G_002264 [Rozella allomycis CSF55]|eukprot:EPZ36198.1 hypothetical protein O9G_002264 [Rozella allomycis CSF55]